MNCCPFMSSKEKVECMKHDCALYDGKKCSISALRDSLAKVERTSNDSNNMISDIFDVVEKISKKIDSL